MIASDEQHEAICAEFGDPLDGWGDSLSLEYLLCVAHDHGVLRDVQVFQLLDVDRDIFLVSVETRPNIYVHRTPTHWRDVGPASDMAGPDAVRHVLQRLGEISEQVIQAHTSAEFS